MGNCNLFNKETEMSLAIKKVIEGMNSIYTWMVISFINAG